MIAWPLALPQRFTWEPYERSLPDGRRMTEPAGGPPRPRREFSSAVGTVSVVLPPVLPHIAMRFETFWSVDTEGGVLPFTVPDQEYDGLPDLDESGNPVLDEEEQPTIISATWLVLFGKPAPVIRPVMRGFKRQISFPLLILP